ncbi:MAG TPA: winged helix-turn-helix domain-containing protein [Steroidobacteraceae bacterium]|nr:winged helix-turn-helix domain-containing protein [Steroidobacteraceae bacterium]
MPDETLYAFGDFQLDAGRRLLSHRSQGPVAITGRVFDTLLHLVRNPGRLVTKRELMDAVWGDAVVEENNLTQTISTLRQLLGERPDEHRYIVTVPGRGYRFIAGVESGAHAPGAPATVAAAPKRWSRRTLIAIAAAGLAAAIGGAVLLSGRFETKPQIHSIAVLPFKPLVRDSGDPALELGMADTLIARLGNSGGLVVRPLSSVRKYTPLDQDALDAGRELGVDAVLEGSIQRSGDVLRVTTRLLRVSDGSSIWADKVDQPWTTLFDMQDKLAEQVAAALALRLSNEERRQLTRRHTQNGAAYRSYLLGRYHFLKLIPSEIDKSIEYFNRAIEQDPQYALPYEGLAEAYRSLTITGDEKPSEVMPRGKAAALRAIELDDRLDSAWASLCFIQIWWDWDWSAAERSCRRAIEINPNGADGHRAYAVLLSDLGRHEQAIAEARRASELDPLALITNAIEGHVLHYAGRDVEAATQLRATLELDANFWIPHLFLGKVHLARNEPQEALAEFEKARALSAANSEAVSMIGYTLALMGDRKGAQATLAELLSRGTEHYVPPFNVAMLYNGLGDVDNTFAWLEKAYADRDVRLTFLKIEKKWDPLRSDERFASLTQRMKL